MRWPWKRETRSGGGYSDAVVQAIEAQASAKVADASSTAAIEAAGPLAQILPIPQDGGDDENEGDPLAALKADIAKARGKAMLVETAAAGWGEGRAAAPQRDWVPSRLGPMPPDSMVNVADAAFTRMLAACGCPPGLFESGADGTSQRESLRRWHQNTVLPLARILEHELAMRLETDVKLVFDGYPLDLQSRASTFQKLVAGGYRSTKRWRFRDCWRTMPSKQLQLWEPRQLQETHCRCATCGGMVRMDKDCNWCRLGGHDRATAVVFRDCWLIAQFPERSRSMPMRVLTE